MAGDNVTLTCSVTLPTGVTDTPDFQWEGPGVTLTPADPTTNRQEVSSVITLSTISTSQAGQYICTATLNGSSMTIATNVTVQSKLLCHLTVVILYHVEHISSSVSGSTPSITVAVSGGAVAVIIVLIVAISVTVVTIVALVLKYRHRVQSIKRDG